MIVQFTTVPASVHILELVKPIDQWFAEQILQYEKDVEFITEGIKLDLADKICEEMNIQDISKEQLSELFSIPIKKINKILACNHNAKISTMVKLALTLGLKLKIDFDKIPNGKKEGNENEQ